MLSMNLSSDIFSLRIYTPMFLRSLGILMNNGNKRKMFVSSGRQFY